MKWLKVAMILMAVLSSNVYASDLREEANHRIKNAAMFNPGDVMELNKGKHFVACSTKENLLKALDYAAKQDTAKMLSMLNDDQCLAFNSSHGKYKVLSVDPQKSDVIEIISVNNTGSEGVWTTSFFDFKK